MADTKSTPVETITHKATRANIPPAELESVLEAEDKAPMKVAYERRNKDLDPQLVWRGKDVSDWSDLVVDAPPIYLQEQVHPKALIEDLRAHVANGRPRSGGNGAGPSLFDHFGLTDEDREAEIEFYRHTRKWSNRMILGDSMQVMASLAEREGLRGKVQCIYIDPPYGIRFNSNFQWSTTSRDVKDGNLAHLTREPEQVKAFRDTWRDGIHSYLTYLRDRLTVARDLLTESGSCFIQIGDENVHRVRALMDEVFGEENFVSQINVRKTATPTSLLDDNFYYVLWYGINREKTKFRTPLLDKPVAEWVSETRGGSWGLRYTEVDYRALTPAERSEPKTIPEGSVYALSKTNSAGPSQSDQRFVFQGAEYHPGRANHWKTTIGGLQRLIKADRLETRGGPPWMRRFHQDGGFKRLTNAWLDTSGKSSERWYVVQTDSPVISRCILMTTDPGDLVLDPTCGSGTTAFVAEQWGRRWITVDTSRVALALARARIMGAKYPYYLLADTPEGLAKEAALSRSSPSTRATAGDIRQGFVYERVPHITLKSIANNTEIDVIWEKMQPAVEAALADLNHVMDCLEVPHPIETGARAGQSLDFWSTDETTLPSGEPAKSDEFLEWEVPRTARSPMPDDIVPEWKEAWRLIGEIENLEPDPAKKDWENEQKAEALQIDLRDCLRSLNEDIYGEGKRHLTRENIPHEPYVPWPPIAAKALEAFWIARIARQREIDASIAAKAEFETLYDKPIEDKKRVRVAGPFTVESLSPHRSVGIDEEGELIDAIEASEGLRRREEQESENYYEAILENLKKAGVQQRDKADRITFTTLKPWPGEFVSADGRYQEGKGEAEKEKRAAIFVGPEYGTVQRADLVAAAREAAEAGFDVLVACAFNFDAHAGELQKLGGVPVLRARMNADLHMAGDLKAGGGNLFVVFGEPDIELKDDGDKIRVELKGLDVFKPQTGEVVSSDAADIACWFIDTDYDMESFFVRQAYFPGADVPYKALKNTLKAEIDEDAWDSLKRTVSRPFARPKTGRIAVKVINHLGDEVMKVMRV
ncbi:MAG: site-specific DNA-methyltransferase [Fulvimarina sp.]|nr:site-specific DNA-methyltransferase [Fulvimarina sp.]